MTARHGRSRHPGTRAERGQALVETALVVGLLMSLLLGVWGAADYMSQKSTVLQAARQGARVGATVGSDGYAQSSTHTVMQSCQGTDPTSPCWADDQIVQAIVAGISRVDNVTVTEIDVYQPTPCSGGGTGVAPPFSATCPPDDGSLQSGAPVDRFTLRSGTWTVNGTYAYTLDKRMQLHSAESSVGVRILYSYRTPTPYLNFSSTTSEYAVEKLPPSFLSG